ncbi:Type I transmembrane sorting receptor [Dissophora globulifera]|uniref:Type I transmembrane sorting receptor n=1 Tax=Dissophora globulifera TaxID=979702 RepID=A0A9P6UY69_9FUNG|nr:Type I transmembrane sorting receptor [Dissophora globulifera]
MLSVSLTLLATLALTLIDAFPRSSKVVYRSGGPYSVPLKHNMDCRANTKALGNQIGTRFARRAAADGPLMEVDHLFTVSVAIGTPAHEYDLVIDTTSAETWFISPTCTSTACVGRKVLEPSHSSSSENQYEDFTVHHGEGAVGHGNLFTDIVAIPGVSIENQVFGIATSLTEPFYNLKGDGVLAFPSFDTRSPSFADNAFEGGRLPLNVFSLYLPRRGDGELTLGGVNRSRFAGDLSYVSLSYPLAWQITIEDIGHRGRSLGITLEATVETTASSILLDTRATKALYRNIRGAKRYTARRWTIPCGSNPYFSITMNGIRFKIPKASINLGPVLEGSRDCVSAITSGAEEGHAILGLAFLQNFYTVFDKTTYPHRIGFATLA